MRRRWPLLGNRDYMLLWGGEMISELGSQTSTVAYPLLVLALSGSAAQAGVVGLAKWLPVAVGALPAGALADRLDRRRLMIACDAARLAGAASIVIALMLGRPPLAQIAVVAFADGALMICSYICERGALPHVVPAVRLQDAFAQNEARSFGAQIVGPPLGGVLFGVARSLPFLVDAVSYLGSIAALGSIRTRFQHARAAERLPRTVSSDLGDGFRWLRGQPYFWTAARLFACGNPVFTGLYLLAILLAKRHGASSAAVGAMFAIIGVAGVLGAVAAGPARRRMTGRTVIVAQQWVLAAAILALLVAPSAPIIGLLVAAAEFGTPITNSAVAGVRIGVVSDQLQGRVAAASAFLSMSLGWLGPLAVGFLFQHAGATVTILAVGGAAAALAVTAILAPGLRASPALDPA